MAHAVVGLGNPGPEYRDTRHNVGQRVVEHLGRTLHRPFGREGHAMVARAQWRGEPLYLIKPISFMNVSGPVVAALLRRLGLGPGDIVLVYDDIDLPLGTVRLRMRGSHGGHNGVRSVIEALGTPDIRRVKVGIGRPDHKGEVPDHVLEPFEPAEHEVVDAAVVEAADRVLGVLATRTGG